MDTASRVDTVEGLVTRHDSLCVAAKIVWCPSLLTTRRVFADRGGGRRTECVLDVELDSRRGRGSAARRLQEARAWIRLRGGRRRHIQKDDVVGKGHRAQTEPPQGKLEKEAVPRENGRSVR